LSQAGQGIFLGAIFWAAGSGGSAVGGASGVFVAMMAGAVLAGVPAGIAIDRAGAGSGLAIGAWLRVLVAALAVFLAGSTAGAFMVALAYSSVSQVFSNSEMAMVHALQRERPARGHAVLLVLQYAGQGAGLVLFAPALYYVGGPAAMLGGAAGVFAAVGLLALFVARRTAVGKRARTGVSLMPALRLLRDDDSVAYASGLLIYFELSVKAMVVALPILAFRELDLGVTALTGLGLAGATGAFTGIWMVTTQLGPDGAARLARPVFASIVALTATLAVFANGVPLVPGAAIDVAGLVPVAAGLGLCAALAPVCGRAVLSRQAPATHQARVFATQGLLSDLVAVVPLAIAGIGTSMAGAGTTFLFLAVVGFASLLCLEFALPRFRREELALAMQPIDE